MNRESAPELADLVTFIPNKSLPIHNWFYYKEGFSRDFVFHFLDRFGAMPGNVVLDPFVGSGTTLLACKERGIDSIGGDVMPVPLFVSRVKTQDYDIDVLQKYRKELITYPFERPQLRIDPFVKRYFEKHVLEDVIFFRDLVNRIQDPTSQDFFRLALMSLAYKDSWIYKDGAVLKAVRKPVAPFRKFFSKGTLRMIKGLEKVNFPPCRTEVMEMDARRLNLGDESVDFVITSPPYLNKIEYAKIYEIENSLFFGGRLKPTIRSAIGQNPENFVDPFPKQELPGNSKAYFYDMQLSIREMFRVLKSGGKAALNVAGGVFEEGVVESDLFFADLAEREGFEVEAILEARKRAATRSRTIKIGEAVESVVVLRKP